MRRRHVACGFSLVELLVAMAIGLLMLGAFLVLLRVCREQFAINDSLSRLHDSARHVWSVLVPDVEHAGFYGFAQHGSAIRLLRAEGEPAPASQLHQPNARRPGTPAAGLPAGAHDCGQNFAVDLARPVQASNNIFALGVAPRDCMPTASAGGARPGSDTLTLRHASVHTSRPHAGRLQIYSRRLASASQHDLFAHGTAPGPQDPDHEIRDLEVRTYYIANSSVDRPGWPALRVKQLTEARGAAQFRDEEILPGVEDLQVELGIRSVVDGLMRLRYVPPDSPDALDRPVITVRLWLRIRADQTESGFRDRQTWRYADATFNASEPEAAFRRRVITRTIVVRPAQSPEFP